MLKKLLPSPKWRFPVMLIFAILLGILLGAGWSTMFASERMELIKSGDSKKGIHWAYIMLSVNPAFINGIFADIFVFN